MKTENYYWKQIATAITGESTANMETVNTYLKKIYEGLGGEETKRKSNQFYLKFLLDYYTEEEEE